MKRYEQALSLLLLSILAGFIVWGLHLMNRNSPPASMSAVQPGTVIVAEH
jgi:hypothetical protein